MRWTHYPINADGRDYVVGDIHGCFGLLEELLEQAGLTEGANSKPAEYVVEKAFLD